MNALIIILIILAALFAVMTAAALIRLPHYRYSNAPEQKNSLEGRRTVFVPDENDALNADGVRGHLADSGKSEMRGGFYESFVKRLLDIVISFFGIVLLSPFFLILIAAIYIDDPGPVFFTQKRVGCGKRYFMLHKFRSMKMSAPHNVPTHMLKNPEQYITRVGKFIRAHSLDELPQIWDIFVGNMSIIGPRPALYNQDVLTAERDLYGANDIRPGLTGWAQINGRDELSIQEKAKLDGEYAAGLSFAFDVKCFWGSIHVIGKDDTIVEGSAKK